MMIIRREIFKPIALRQEILTGLFLLLLLFPRVVEAACVCGGGDGQFTTSSITIDGTMNDWSSVLADPDNNSCDKTGDSGPSTGRDLVQFAFTWDNTNVFTYTERSDSPSNAILFIYYADTNNDGFMESGEPVIFADWQGSNQSVGLSIGTYVPANSGGDSMVDINGYGDDYTLPGKVSNLQDYSQLSGHWGSSDGYKMEWAVPWSLLGIPAGTAFSFHVSSSNSTNIPSQVDDNMGGCGGRAATTQYADLTFTPDRSLQTGLGATVYGAHTLTNSGNGTDTFNFMSTSSGFTVTYYLDADDSGTFTSGDNLLSDTDGDGKPDTGPLTAGGSIQLLIAYAVPTSGMGTAVTTSAISRFDSSQDAPVTDTIQIVSPNLTVVKSASGPSAKPGDVITYTVQVLNTGNGDATSVVLDDHMSPYTAWQLNFDGSVGGPPFAPFSLNPGTSGLSLGTPDYSRDGGTTWFSEAGLTSGGGGAPAGYDGTITNWKLPMTGSMAPGGSFILQYKVKVK